FLLLVARVADCADCAADWTVLASGGSCGALAEPPWQAASIEAAATAVKMRGSDCCDTGESSVWCESEDAAARRIRARAFSRRSTTCQLHSLQSAHTRSNLSVLRCRKSHLPPSL